MALFNGANNVIVHGGSFVANAGGSPSLDKLVAEVASNAILNAGGRADEVRCFPGTRDEVITRLEEFMDNDRADKKRMMWLSGPAGAGKSSICQTVAERRSVHGRQAANFFFFRGDSTRSHAKPLVATLVYQLRHFYPALDEPLSDRLETDPLICSASIEAQFKQLISIPIQTIQQSAPIQQQITIIIDGLDECNETRDQDQILVALHALAHADHSPFLVLVSSRAEPHLVMSFNRLECPVESIFLNDDYQPQKDIRLFVVEKFAEIKRTHHLARNLDEKWPTDADIDMITKKSSGQFIYAAIVMRFIQFSSSSPAFSLVTILKMPSSTDHNPLAHLDAVYSYIFSKVPNIRVVKLILFARNCSKTVSEGKLVPSIWFGPMLRLAGYEDTEVESFFADLAAVIQVVPGSSREPLVFHHASLDDYLSDKTRSTIYYVNEEEIAAELSSMCLENIHDARSIQLAMNPLSHVQKPTPQLSKSLLDASTRRFDNKKLGSSLKHLIGHIERLYWEQDKDQFKTLLQSWSRFIDINNINPSYRNVVCPQNPSASQYYEQYWMNKGYTGIDPNNNDGMETGIAERRETTAAPDRSDAVLSLIHELLASLRREVVTGRQPHSAIGGAINTHKEEEERYRSGEYDGGPHELSMIRVKLHYQDDIRGMTLTPDAPFSEFLNKVAAKFGKNPNDLTMKLEDESGGKITLCDDSDYEFAIETARQRSKGEVKGILVIWCEDGVR